jgi:hypothetical protein
MHGFAMDKGCLWNFGLRSIGGDVALREREKERERERED